MRNFSYSRKDINSCHVDAQHCDTDNIQVVLHVPPFIRREHKTRLTFGHGPQITDLLALRPLSSIFSHLVKTLILHKYCIFSAIASPYYFSLLFLGNVHLLKRYPTFPLLWEVTEAFIKDKI